MSVKKINFPLVGILIYFIVISLYKIDAIPGEWFGDVSIVNDYVREIINLRWPLYFSTSQGPLYFYLIAPLISVLGVSFISYKICSIITGIVGLIIIYFLVKKISNKHISLIATFLTASSFWYLVWCRLGYNIIGPVITSLTLMLFFYYLHSSRNIFLYSAIFISCLGITNYAGTFLLPLALIIIIYITNYKSKKCLSSYAKPLLVFILLIIPAAIVMYHQTPNFSSGYIGEKILWVQKNSFVDNIKILIINFIRTMKMFHFEGDIVFRWNVSLSPHIDFLSGIFLVVGLIYSLLKKRFVTLLLLTVALILIIPSIYPGHPSVEVPSSPRTNAIIPIIMYIVSAGIYSTVSFINKYSRSIARIVLILILIFISYSNLYKYFIVYPKGLPNNNTPFGKIIAHDIDKLPQTTLAYLTGVGWGDWGQPELDGIYYALSSNRKTNSTILNIITSCDQINVLADSYVILNPSNLESKQLFISCFPQSEQKNHYHNNHLVYTSLSFPSILY